MEKSKGQAVRVGIGHASDIREPFFTRFVFTIVNACMAATIAFGVVLACVGYYYVSEISDEGFGGPLIAIGIAIAMTGGLGLLGCMKRLLSLLLFAQLLLLLCLISLYVSFCVAFMMAIGAQNPVNTAVDAAWEQGFRKDLLEREDRWCVQNTDLTDTGQDTGACKRFYRDADQAVRASAQQGDNSCNITVVDIALDCQKSHTFCGSSSANIDDRMTKHCHHCDDLCKNAVKDTAKKQLKPAVTVNVVVFVVVLVDIFVINYLLGQSCRLESHVKVGYALNGIVGGAAFITMLFIGVVAHEIEASCPPHQDCTSWTLGLTSLVTLGLTSIAVLAVFALWSEKDVLLQIANLLFILAAFLLLLMAIVLGMASDIIQDINAYFEENWPSIRVDLENLSQLCDEVDCQHSNASWADGACSLDPIPRPELMNVNTDPCRPIVEQQTKDEAVTICSYAFVVIMVQITTIYFNQRGIIQLNKLGAYQDKVMGGINEARVVLMAQQALILAERNALENTIATSKAKLEARLGEMEAGKRNSPEGQALEKQINKMGKKKGKSKSKNNNPLHRS